MNDWTRRQLNRMRQAPDWLQDLLLAIAVSQADLVSVLGNDGHAGPLGSVPRPVAAVVVILISLPLVFRRINPNLVMALTGFAAGAAGAVGIPNQALAPLVALYTVAAYLPLLDTVVSTSIFLAITTWLLAAGGDLPGLYSNTLLVVGVAVIGRIVQANRSQTLQLEARARELERSRDAQAQLAVTTERERIAREMHDVLAHSTSVMVVQATGARRMLPDRLDAAAEALQVIEETGRRSLAELRRMLGLLREEASPAQPQRPQPGLADVEELVATFAAAGLPVELRRTKPLPIDIDASVALSTYRVIQEALTNVMKHAEAQRVTVDLCPLPDRLLVEVLDDGGRVALQRRRSPRGDRAPRLHTAGGGFGLIGMRERVALVGGSLEAGPRPGGGYRVAAVLPLRAHHERPGPPQATGAPRATDAPRVGKAGDAASAGPVEQAAT